MEEENIKGVKLSKQQQEELKNNDCVSYLLSKNYRVDINKMLDYINQKSYSYKVFMTDTSFNFFYNCYRSNAITCDNLFNEYTYTYGSFIDNMESLVDDYIRYNNILGKIILICDCNFQWSAFGPMVYEIFDYFYDGCVKKGAKIKDKYDLEDIFFDKLKILFLTNKGKLPMIMERSSKLFDVTYYTIAKSDKYSSYDTIYQINSKIIKFQRENYFSNINNTISLYNVIKDNQQLEEVFNKLEKLNFKKTVNYTTSNIRHTFVKPLKKQNEFIAFYTVCFIEDPINHDIRIEPYVFMPNISVENSKIPLKFKKLENQTALLRPETLKLLVNYNLLLLLNEECNLNMTQENMDIDKISFCFGNREPSKNSFVDLLTQYDKSLYSFDEMSNILTDEALNTLGTGNKKLLDALIEDSLYYFKLENTETRFGNIVAIQKAKNNLFSKIKITDENFSSVIGQMYRYLSDGFMENMNFYGNNNYVPTSAGIMLFFSKYCRCISVLANISRESVYDSETINKYIEKTYGNTDFANELKMFKKTLDEITCNVLSFDNINFYHYQDYFINSNLCHNYDEFKNVEKIKMFEIAREQIITQDEFKKVLEKEEEYKKYIK